MDGCCGIFVIKDPDTIVNSFQIMSGPYGLAITGDLGDYTCYQNKTWKWLRGATGDYLAGKMQVKKVVDIECVRELARESEDNSFQLLRNTLAWVDDDLEIDLNDNQHSLFLERVYDSLGEIPTKYKEFDVGKLSAMTMKFDELLTAQGI